MDLPDLEADVRRLEEQLSSALRETATNWSNTPLWKILADNPENPYGLSKIGLRRYQKTLERKLKRIERERAKSAKRMALERSRRAKEKRLRDKCTYRSSPKGVLTRLRSRASEKGVPFDISLEEVDGLLQHLENRGLKGGEWSIHLKEPSLGFTIGNIIVKTRR